MKNYKKPYVKSWKGRVDSLDDRDAFRIHQVVKPLDLTEEIKLSEKLSGFGIIGYCCDEGVVRNLGRKGASKGYEAVKKQLSNLPVPFDDFITIYDCGEVVCEDKNMEAAQISLAKIVEKVFNLGLFPIVIGGGHDVAYGSFKGINSKFEEKNTGIINFDAHFDLREVQEKGNSGTMFSQISNDLKKQNKQFFYLPIGIQLTGNTKYLFKKAESLGVDYILAKDLEMGELKLAKNKIKEFVEKVDNIYITICLDVFSSAHAPGVSAPQPFGLSPKIVMNLFKYVLTFNKTIIFDIAEISPRFDNDNKTAKLVAIFIYAIVNSIQFPEFS